MCKGLRALVCLIFYYFFVLFFGAFFFGQVPLSVNCLDWSLEVLTVVLNWNIVSVETKYLWSSECMFGFVCFSQLSYATAVEPKCSLLPVTVVKNFHINISITKPCWLFNINTIGEFTLLWYSSFVSCFDWIWLIMHT
jgi:hypothetical protein